MKLWNREISEEQKGTNAYNISYENGIKFCRSDPDYYWLART